MAKKIYNAGNPKDKSGKLMVHPSQVRTGLHNYFTSRGDDDADVANVGGGIFLGVDHDIGDTTPLTFYVEWNCAMNETWMREGRILFKNCLADKIDFGLVPRVVASQAGASTNYNEYGGYLVVPAAGDGTLDLTGDLTQPDGGLIHMPVGDTPSSTPKYWNADFNTSTKLFENITAAAGGDGEYNMFTIEVWLTRFAHALSLLGDGDIHLESTDTAPVGQGMRMKVVAETFGTDHDWDVSAILTMSREKTF